MGTYTCPSTGQLCSEAEFNAEVAAQQAVVANRQATTGTVAACTFQWLGVCVSSEEWYARQTLLVQVVASGGSTEKIYFDNPYTGESVMVSEMGTKTLIEAFGEAGIGMPAALINAGLETVSYDTIQNLFVNQLLGYTADPTTGVLKQTASALADEVVVWSLYKNMAWDNTTIATALGLTEDQVAALLAKTTKIVATTEGSSAVDASTASAVQSQMAAVAASARPSIPIFPIIAIAGIVVVGIAAYFLIPSVKGVRA